MAFLKKKIKIIFEAPIVQCRRLVTIFKMNITWNKSQKLVTLSQDVLIQWSILIKATLSFLLSLSEHVVELLLESIDLIITSCNDNTRIITQLFSPQEDQLKVVIQLEYFNLILRYWTENHT